MVKDEVLRYEKRDGFIDLEVVIMQALSGYSSLTLHEHSIDGLLFINFTVEVDAYYTVWQRITD